MKMLGDFLSAVFATLPDLESLGPRSNYHKKTYVRIFSLYILSDMSTRTRHWSAYILHCFGKG